MSVGMHRGRVSRRNRATKIDAATMSGPYYTAIPASPVLDANSAAKVATLAGITNKLARLSWATVNFAVPSDPSYTIVYDADPLVQSGQTYSWAFGARSLSAEEYDPIRIPDPPNFYPEPGSYADGAAFDGWGVIADLARSLVFSGWRMVKSGSNWQAATSGAFAIPGTLVTPLAGGGRGDGNAVFAGVITVQEAAAAVADTSGTYVFPHALALQVPSQISDSAFRAPARGTDGTVTPTTSTISHGSRFMLPSSATTASTNKIIQAIVRTLKVYGAYITDRTNTSGPVNLVFERFDPANPGDMVTPTTGAASSVTASDAIAGVYYRAGWTTDYVNLNTVIPWSSLQLLQQWDGTGTGTPTTVTAGVAVTADDGNASFSTLTTTPVLGTNFGDTAARSFFRFAGVTVPAGKTISSATLTLTKGFADTGTLSTVIKGHNVDSSGAFTTAASVTSAALTTAASATLTSTQAAWSTAGTVTVDVTTVVAAVLGRAGWVSGNALSLLSVDTGSTGNGYFEVASQSASLSITYV